MPEHRIWHPSRDASHCAFRLMRLIAFTSNAALEVEWARILDMYLLFPVLLHRASMPEAVRAAFRALAVPKPDDIFIRLPSPVAVFQDLRLFQNSAMAQLAAKGIVDREEFVSGNLKLTLGNLPKELSSQLQKRNSEQIKYLEFLTSSLGSIPLRGADNVYKRLGLPNRPVLS